MTTVFFYARLWRRSGVLTDLEFYELRYSGAPARWCAGSARCTSASSSTCVIMATVNLAAAKIANVLLGWPMGRTLLICGVLNVAFAATSGLWGVLVTDFIQFGIAMTGAFAAAVLALKQPAVGGLTGCWRKCRPSVAATCCRTSRTGARRSPCSSCRSPCSGGRPGIPGAEPGGGSYIAQRMLAARTERDALSGTLLFNVAHYALRPWPWIIVALRSMLVFPNARRHSARAARTSIRGCSATTWRTRRCSRSCRPDCWA